MSISENSEIRIPKDKPITLVLPQQTFLTSSGKIKYEHLELPLRVWFKII